MRSGLRGWLLFSIIFALSLILRLVVLDADPPRPISGGPSPNEGLYVHNARNKAIEGQWRTDEWNSTVVQPLGSMATAAVFKLAGTGLTQSRLVSVILSAAGLLLFFGLVKDGSGTGTALLAALFLGTNSIFLTYSRLAGPAPLGIFLMLLTILLWRLGVRYPVCASLAGVALAVAAVIENGPHNIFFVATAALATLMVRLQAWKMPWAPAVRKRVRSFWAAAFLTLVGWAITFVIPNWNDFARMLNTPLSSARWGSIPQNLFMAPFNFGRLVQWTPITCLIALVYFLIFARTLMAPIARHRPLSETRVWFFAWLVTAPVFMALRFERPLNVLVLLVPPLCVAVAEALMLLLSLREIRKPRLDIVIVLGLLAFVTWFTVQGVVHLAVLAGYQRIPQAFFEHQFRYEFGLVFLIATPIVILLAHLWLRWKKFSFEMSPAFVSSLFAVLLAGILATNAYAAISMFRGEKDVRNAGRTVSELPQGSIVAGTWAPLLTLESGYRGFVIWPGMNDRAKLGPGSVTHLLLQRGSRESLPLNPSLREMNVDVNRQVRWLRPLKIGLVELDLYEVSL
jgi:hypothetical protein